jgi:fused signal recognition particle receptor
MATSWQEMIDLGSREPAKIEQPEEAEPEQRRGGVFRRLRESLSKSRQALQEEISASVFEKIDDETWELLEEALILADVGAPTTAAVVERLEHEVDSGAVPAEGEPIRERLIEMLAEVASTARAKIDLSAQPAVLMMVGVNGTGKTTTIGKIAWHLSKEFGLSVVMGAGDTYRAAAAEQLATWAERAGAELVRGQDGADPGAVAYDAVSAAVARKADVVIIDTAGRLHTKTNLMAELEKMRRTVSRVIPDAPHEVLLVIEATTGQNGLEQARKFTETSAVTGIILTKLDGTAKGGVVVAISRELNLPIRYVGVGEQLDDLLPFDPAQFVASLFD